MARGAARARAQPPMTGLRMRMAGAVPRRPAAAQNVAIRAVVERRKIGDGTREGERKPGEIAAAAVERAKILGETGTHPKAARQAAAAAASRPAAAAKAVFRWGEAVAEAATVVAGVAHHP